MAHLLAPYQPAMRLGSGFNSYTQQVCVDNAVTRESSTETMTGLELGETSTEIAQSVIFKTEVIRKMSDITDALDINGRLNIKASNIANARGNGVFVNSNAIKESDLNFLITCKVVNQINQDNTLTKFNSLANMKDSTFTDIFGDSFISGFQVGGEFAGLISIKVHDKEQLDTISAEAQIAFTTPNFIGKGETDASEAQKPAETSSVASGDLTKPGEKSGAASTDKPESKGTSGKTVAPKSQQAAAPSGKGVSIDADAKFKKTRKDIMSNNTVTISVSWTGGGQKLKTSSEDWNFETLRAAAIKFPELVAKTPIVTHAILTKYSTLRSYHQAISKSPATVPASYENAGVYTTMLQDAYLDYKNLYKDLQLLGMDVDAGKLSLTVADRKLLFDTPADDKKPPKEDTPKEPEAPVTKTDPSESGSSNIGDATPASSTKSSSSPSSTTKDPNKDSLVPKDPLEVKYAPFTLEKPYPATLIGIEYAKRDIRKNMSRILAEVDCIAKNPLLAMDDFRELTFLSPLIFKQYLPKGVAAGDLKTPASGTSP